MKKRRKKKDVYQIITDKVIQKIEQGVNPWKKMWAGNVAPRNYVSGYRYTGINYFLASLCDYDTPYFLTFNQIKKLEGAKLKKGSNGLPIVYWLFSYVDEDGNWYSEKQVKKAGLDLNDLNKVSTPRYYTVFNIEDVEGYEFDTPEIPEYENDPIERAEKVVKGYVNGKGPKLMFGGTKAYYNPRKDFVKVPELKRFENSAAYYSTLFHELVHSTGNAKRLDREEIQNFNFFGDKDYSKEELTAEMGAVFLLNEVGISREELLDNSAAYLKGWLAKLKSDKKFLFAASTNAKKAVQYILEA